MMQKLGQTTDPIAAHLWLGSIAVEETHTKVGPCLPRQQENHPISTDTETAITEGNGLLGGQTGLGLLAVVHQDKVVPQSLVLVEQKR
jgi:hypothetical protein